MLMGTDHGGIDMPSQIQLACRVSLGQQRLLDPGPGPIIAPPGEPLVERLERTIALRYVPPRATSPDPEQDAVDDLPVITPPAATPRRGRRQQRRNMFVLSVSELKTTNHAQPTTDQTAADAVSPIRETRSRWLVLNVG
jgi:hypothetical protein